MTDNEKTTDSASFWNRDVKVDWWLVLKIGVVCITAIRLIPLIPYPGQLGAASATIAPFILGVIVYDYFRKKQHEIT